MKTGIITAIDREVGRVRALPFPWGLDESGRPQQVWVGYSTMVPPTPLCIAYFTDDLRRCVGSQAQAHLVLHEDFLSYAWDSVARNLKCDNRWVAGSITGTPQISRLDLLANVGAGVLRFTAGDVSFASSGSWIIQAPSSYALTAADALWMSMRILVEAPLGAMVLEAGFQDELSTSIDNVGEQVRLSFYPPTSPNWSIQGRSDFTTPQNSYTDSGVAVVAGEWVWVDIFFVPGSYAALWIGGRGPAFVSPVPPKTVAVSPYVWLRAGDAGTTYHVQVDTVEVRAVFNKGLPHPSSLPI